MDAAAGTVEPPGAPGFTGLLMTAAGSLLSLLFAVVEPPGALNALAWSLVAAGLLLAVFETWCGARGSGVGLWRSLGRSTKAALGWLWSWLP